MKPVTLLLGLMISGHVLLASPMNSNSNVKTPISFNDTTHYEPSVRELLDDIMKVIGLKSDFELKEGKVLNVEAYISKHKRYILYNPEYVEWVRKSTHDKWGVLALLAHEVGHHLNGHTVKKSGSKPAVELEADEFAGFVLARLGATAEQAKKIMIYIATMESSSSHPGRTERMAAIQRGWDKAKS